MLTKMRDAQDCKSGPASPRKNNLLPALSLEYIDQARSTLVVTGQAYGAEVAYPLLRMRWMCMFQGYFSRIAQSSTLPYLAGHSLSP